MKGTEPFPSSIYMVQDSAIQAIEVLINKLLEDSGDIFIVSVKIKPTNNIKVYLDADSGLSIEKCIKINRALYKNIEEEGWYPDGNFSLEVSSPGVDEPLKSLRQYKKNIGRKVEVTLLDGTKKEGKLTAVNDEAFTIEYVEGKNKKAVTISSDITFADVKQTTVVISF